MSERTIRNKVMKLKELEEQKKAMEKEIDDLKDQIKAEMDRRETEVMTVGDYIVRYKKLVNSRFDGKAFKEEHPRLYKAYLQTSETRRFSIA